MQVGSLVECINGEAPSGIAAPFVTWIPSYGEILTVREIIPVEYVNNSDEAILLFEEHVIGVVPGGKEIGAPISDFREIQPPMDLTELLKETEPQTVLVTR